MFQNYHGDKVIVHCPITFNESSEGRDEVESAKDSASKTYTSSLTCDQDWKRFTENDFKLKEETTEDQVVLLYNKPPPVLLKSKESDVTSGCNEKEASCLEGYNENKTTSVVSWCRSSYLKHTTKNHEYHDCCSPTDHLRYKTCIRIKGASDDWTSVWDKLCKSLQSGKYEYCNAYLNDGEEISIYHYGWQNIMIGEWIWQNIKCEYEKSSTVVAAS